MNEVRPIQVTAPVVARAASSEKVDEAKDLPPSGKELPIEEIASEQTDFQAATAEKIEEAVGQVNEYVQSFQRDLHFSVDEDSGLTIIRVRDKESGELIRQIPEDIFLNLAQKLKDGNTFHLFDAHS